MEKLFQAALVALMLVPSVGLAQDGDVPLDCAFSRTYNDAKNEWSETSGSDTWILHYEDGSITSMTVPFNCDGPPKVQITDKQIWVSCHLANTYQRTASIDRISGEYIAGFSIGSSGLTHFGQCKTVERKF